MDLARLKRALSHIDGSRPAHQNYQNIIYGSRWLCRNKADASRMLDSYCASDEFWNAFSAVLSTGSSEETLIWRPTFVGWNKSLSLRILKLSAYKTHTPHCSGRRITRYRSGPARFTAPDFGWLVGSGKWLYPWLNYLGNRTGLSIVLPNNHSNTFNRKPKWQS